MIITRAVSSKAYGLLKEVRDVADVAELADATALGAVGETYGGSNPSVRILPDLNPRDWGFSGWR